MNDITKAEDRALRGSLNAMRRSAGAARKVAIWIVKDGQLLRISAEELRRNLRIVILDARRSRE